MPRSEVKCCAALGTYNFAAKKTNTTVSAFILSFPVLKVLLNKIKKPRVDNRLVVVGNIILWQFTFIFLDLLRQKIHHEFLL